MQETKSERKLLVMTGGFSDEVTFEQEPETKEAESHTFKKKKKKGKKKSLRKRWKIVAGKVEW